MAGLIAHYLWWLLALLLLAMEVVFAGYFLLWIALGAAATGVVSWYWPTLSWGGQVASFVVLAFAACGLSVRFRRRRNRPLASHTPTLNRRGEQLLGKEYLLVEPIDQGRGRVQVADSLWLVNGPELPRGSRVRVVAVRGIVLEVVPVAADPSLDAG